MSLLGSIPPNNRVIERLHESCEASTSDRYTASRTEIRRFFNQHDQRTCHMGGLTALISVQGCLRIKANVRQFLRKTAAERKIETGPVKRQAEYCPECRYWREKNK